MAFEQNNTVNLINVDTVLKRANELWGSKKALIFDHLDKQYSFSDVKNKAEEFALVFKSLGIKRKDKVAVMLENVPEFPFTWLALGLLGSVLVPMNYRYQSFDAEYILQHSESKLIVTTYEKVAMLSDIQNTLNKQFKIITVDKKHPDAGFLHDLLNKTQDIFEYELGNYEETLMNIQYTSGTTGKPKGCLLSQKYWINIGEKISNPNLIGITEADTLLTSQPFYYMDPQWNTMSALVNGSTLVVLSHFSPSVFWEKVRKYKVTFFYVLGNMPTLLLKMPVSEDDKNHQVRYIGCSAIPPNLQESIEDRWGVPWYEVFGMTETGYDISMPIDEHSKYVGTTALGRPAIDREVRVVLEDGEFAPRGTVGEMVLRGKGLMDGYYKNEEATNKAFRNGWFHTGDLVYMNEEGILFYVGRIKDMIRRSGENIAAVEVEEVLMLSNVVQMAACTPVEDEIRGEEVKAYIIPKGEVEDVDALIKEIIAFSQTKLASFKIPRYWEIRQSFPTTPSERIAKHLLKEDKFEFYDRVENTWKS